MFEAQVGRVGCATCLDGEALSGQGVKRGVDIQVRRQRPDLLGSEALANDAGCLQRALLGVRQSVQSSGEQGWDARGDWDVNRSVDRAPALARAHEPALVDEHA